MISGVNWQDLEVKNIITRGGDGVVGYGNLSGAKLKESSSSTTLGPEFQAEELVEQLYRSAGRGGLYGEWRGDFFYQEHNKGRSEVWVD